MNFNDEQRAAVKAPLQNIAVIAGAGSGKTRVLVGRFMYLCEYYKFNPNDIIMVTFTNKAANEMKWRLAKEMNTSAKYWNVGTFHGLANVWLRKYYKEARVSQTFQILDSSDQRTVLLRIIKSLGLNPKVTTPTLMQNAINALKDNAIRYEELPISTKEERELKQVYEVYQTYCDERGLLDFGELLFRWYETLKFNEDLLEKLRNRFRNILIDEFQDANIIQRKWLELMNGENGCAFVVGDDDQSIYSWRGATVTNLQMFTYDFKNVLVLKLEENYRSTRMILWAANSIIKNNTVRFDKTLKTNNQTGYQIKEYCARNEEEEAAYVADVLNQWKEKGNLLKDAAILYRSNIQSREFEERFIKEALPYRIYGGLKFFERQEIKDVISYLRLAIDENDDESFERAIQVPPIGIGEQSIEKILEFARLNNLSMFRASCVISSNSSKFLPPKIKQAIKGFCLKMEEIKRIVTELELKLDSLIENVIIKSGIMDFYKKRENLELSRVENLEELVNATYGFEIKNLELTALQNFLNHVALETRDKESNKNVDSVQMMTIHSAKGLEFRLVFIVGFEEGIFPTEVSKGSGIEEERRIAYVGITRAKEYLYFTRAENRIVRGFIKANSRSQFIEEINQNLINSNRYKIQPAYEGSIYDAL